jgi:hypothetical protein
MQIPLTPSEATQLVERVVHHSIPHMHSEDEESDDGSSTSDDVWASVCSDAAGTAQSGLQASNGAGMHGATGFTPQGLANSVWALGVLRADAVATRVHATSDNPQSTSEGGEPAFDASQEPCIGGAREQALLPCPCKCMESVSCWGSPWTL